MAEQTSVNQGPKMYYQKTGKLRDNDPEEENWASTKVDSKDNWKFKFRNGEIVGESEIGVKDSALTFFQMSKSLNWCLWLNISRLSLLHVILEVIIFVIIGNSYANWNYLKFFIVTYLLIIILELSFFFYFYLKVKRMENNWNHYQIHKIKKGTASWTPVQFRKLRVGDLVLLRNGTVAPADILIIDTSNTHFSEQILNVNERRVTGCNRMTVKRAVKNMRIKIGTKNEHEALKNILPSLEGRVEYERPSERVSEFKGTFELTNDPKKLRIDHKNVLFCGTQLHTAWMMGIVLYTGKQTKIVQMNQLKWEWFERLRKETKVSKISILINYILMSYLITSCIVAFLLISQSLLSSKYNQASEMIERLFIGSSYKLHKVVMILQGPMMFFPHLIVLVYELACFAYGIKIQKKEKVISDEKMQAITDKIASGVEIYRRSVHKKKSSRNIEFGILDKDPEINEGFRNTGFFSGRKARGTGLPLEMRTGRIGSTYHTNLFGTVGVKGTGRVRTGRGEINTSQKQAKVINYEALPDLGNINHVVFDKTDTLTMSTMHVCQIATTEKIYRFENENRLQELMRLFDSKPQEFEFEEDEEEKRAKEEILYSEKSQEYESEIVGDYHMGVQEENSQESIGISFSPEYFLEQREFLEKELSDSESSPSEYMDFNRNKSHLSSLKMQKIMSGTVSRMNDGKSHYEKENQLFEDDCMNQLIVLEKQFKKLYGRGDESFCSENSSQMSNLFDILNGPRLKLNNEKPLIDRHLVADIRKRNDSLEELLSYLYVMHLMEYGSQNHNQNYMRPEDEAISEVVRILGFSSSKPKKAKDLGIVNANVQSITDMYQFFISTSGGLQTTYKVYAINMYSHKRGRKSMIIETKSENDPYQLIVVGTEKSMKNILKPSRLAKEDNLLKILFAKQRQKGLKSLVIGRKSLSKNDVINYIKEYSKISNSARDQIEDLEVLAQDQEKDIIFVGSIALRDSIRTEAMKLTKELAKTQMRMSIMSGDDLENCMTVVQKLQLSKIDIQNSASFYGIRLATETGILQEMRRIFDLIHDSLQSESLRTIEKIIKVEKEDTKVHPEPETPQPPMPSATDPKTTQESLLNLSNSSDDLNPSTALHFSSSDSMKKTLLISGPSVERLMQTPYLAQHLRSILSYSGSVIGYNLRPKHKAFLVDLLRKNGEVVMAVGDGFNDLGMLARAHIGIQVSTPNVPLIFGDIVVSSLGQITPLLFHHGLTLSKNLLVAFTLNVNLMFQMIMLPVFAAFFLNYTVNLRLSLAQLIGLHGFQLLMMAPLAIVNRPHSKQLLEKYPAVYLEGTVGRVKAQNYLVLYAIWGILETLASYTVAAMFLADDLHSEGFSMTIQHGLKIVLFTLLPINLWKYCLSHSRFRVCSSWLYDTLLFLGIYILFVLALFLFPNPMNSVDATQTTSSWMLIQSFSFLFIIKFYAVYIVYAYCKKHYFHPASGILNQFSQENYKKATNERVLKYLQSLMKDGDDLYILAIKHLKKPFKRLADMDNSLRRIINLDFHNSNMGLGKLTNNIVDETERKRFMKYLNCSLNKNHIRTLLCMCLGMVAILVLFNNLFNQQTLKLSLGTYHLYFGITIIVLLVIVKFKFSIMMNALVGSVIGLSLASSALLIAVRLPFFTNSVVIKRFFSTTIFTIPIEISYMSCILYEIAFFIHIYVDRNTNIPDGNFTIFLLRLFMANLLILLLRLIAIRKNDRLMKIDFLNNIRIHNEKSSSREKMQMLMPEFIIDRISNFEISKNFVTDDAGEIAVLFAEICGFEDVIKENNENVVEIIDDLFRVFDKYCKENHIQKIETVGKTYMAAGGLKFVEEKIINQSDYKHFILRITHLAKKMFDYTGTFAYKAGKYLKIKIGVHYGSCIFGVLGYHKPQFSLIGDTINTTSRVCTTGRIGTVTLSRKAYEKLKEMDPNSRKNKKKTFYAAGYYFEKAIVDMKGKGSNDTYILQDANTMKKKEKEANPNSKKTIGTSDNMISGESASYIPKRYRNSHINDSLMDMEALKTIQNRPGSASYDSYTDKGEKNLDDSLQSGNSSIEKFRSVTSNKNDPKTESEKLIIKHSETPNDSLTNSKLPSNYQLGDGIREIIVPKKVPSQEETNNNNNFNNQLEDLSPSLAPFRNKRDSSQQRTFFPGVRGSPIASPRAELPKSTLKPVQIEEPKPEGGRNTPLLKLVTAPLEIEPEDEPKQKVNDSPSPRVKGGFTQAAEYRNLEIDVERSFSPNSRPKSKGSIREKNVEYQPKSLRFNEDVTAGLSRMNSENAKDEDSFDLNDSLSDNSEDELTQITQRGKTVAEQNLAQNPRAIEYFKQKNQIRYSSTTNLCLALLLLDVMTAELYNFTESNTVVPSSTRLVVNYAISLTILLMIITKVVRTKIILFKSIMFLLFVLRVGVDTFGMYNTSNSTRPEEIGHALKNFYLRAMIESMFMEACGLFYTRETLAVNSILMIFSISCYIWFDRKMEHINQVIECCFFLIFSVFETIVHYKFESQCFYSMMVANKTGIQYIKFVNRLLPKHIQSLTSAENRSEIYRDVTVLYADICGFTSFSSASESRQIVEMLSKLFTEFDKECNRLNLFKLYTIGDCYVVMGFLDKHNRKPPAEEAHDVVQFAFSMIKIINKVRNVLKFSDLNMRIGIHTVREV